MADQEPVSIGTVRGHPMNQPTIVLRRWSPRIRTLDEDEYVAYIKASGLHGHQSTPGNLGSRIFLRALSDGSTEVTTLSRWESMAAITAFAGSHPEVARCRATRKADRFPLEKPDHVEHRRVVPVGSIG
jgi:heme-degrading monooxygenase HmoA